MRVARTVSCFALLSACVDEPANTTQQSMDPATAERDAGASSGRDAQAAPQQAEAGRQDERLAESGENLGPCRDHAPDCDPELRCPLYCTSDADQVCRGEEGGRCDGCPERSTFVDGDLCGSPGLYCYYPPACGGDEATCDPGDAGAPRWIVVSRACDDVSEATSEE